MNITHYCNARSTTPSNEWNKQEIPYFYTMIAWNIVKTYKQYLALILVPYLFLIVIFHTQLTVYDGPGRQDDGDRDGVNGLFAAG